MIDESLLTRLYGSREDGWLPYLVFGKPGEPGTAPTVLHVPGKHGARPSWSGAKAYPMHGYRGVSVMDYRRPVDQQPVKLCWAGIDIDFEDNVETADTVKLADRVSDLLFNEAIVRTSKSGRGVHALFVLHSAYTTDYATAQILAKRIVAEPVKRLQAAGITKCVSGLPNLWLWSEGGKQRTVSDTGCTIGLPENADSVYTPERVYGAGAHEVSVARFSGLAQKALTALPLSCRTGLYNRRYNVNIGVCKRALDGIGIKLNTKSKCRPEHAGEVNGFLELTDEGELRLISNADDNKCILYLASF